MGSKQDRRVYTTEAPADVKKPNPKSKEKTDA